MRGVCATLNVIWSFCVCVLATWYHHCYRNAFGFLVESLNKCVYWARTTSTPMMMMTTTSTPFLIINFIWNFFIRFKHTNATYRIRREKNYYICPLGNPHIDIIFQFSEYIRIRWFLFLRAHCRLWTALCDSRLEQINHFTFSFHPFRMFSILSSPSNMKLWSLSKS